MYWECKEKLYVHHSLSLLISGYVEAAIIPKGAISITVSESKPCTSFLGKLQLVDLFVISLFLEIIKEDKDEIIAFKYGICL